MGAREGRSRRRDKKREREERRGGWGEGGRETISLRLWAVKRVCVDITTSKASRSMAGITPNIQLTHQNQSPNNVHNRQLSIDTDVS